MILRDGQYEIGGVGVVDLANRHGTPLYVYDTAVMRKRFEEMLGSFAVPKMKILYACKALTNINVLRFFRALGAGLDAVSIEEVLLGLRSGFTPEDIVFTPNSVSIEEIEAAAAHGVRVNIDNISILEQFGHHHGDRVPVGIRINPHIEAGGHEKISVGHIDSKFGISIHQLPHVLRVVEANGMRIEGIHMHTGSEIIDVEVFLDAAEVLLEAARKFDSLEYIDFGSGFKVAYRAEDEPTDVQALGTEFSARFNRFCHEYGRELTLMFEPGKYLVSEAGYFLVRANVVKHTTSAVFVGVDSGFNHFIRPMFYDAYHHIVNVSNVSGRQRMYTVVGYICETDTFGWNRKMVEVREGDVLCFQNAGAYCFMMSSNYNMRPRPPEVLIHGGRDYLVRRREELSDLLGTTIDQAVEFGAA
jgi:diaminopimelate decarboxylase